VTRTIPRAGLAGLTLVLAALLAAVPAAATTITIINLDGPGEGFNDPTPAAPVGGNPGTTVGQQRLNAFNFAASIWEAILDSPVEIRIGARFDPLSCGPTGGVLGAAGPAAVYRDYPGAPLASTWYVAAAADLHSGGDRNQNGNDISATFNANIGTAGCLENSSWYYGFDDAEPAGGINLVIVLLHEFSHGLGFLSLVDESSGTAFNGVMDVYSRYLLDLTTGLHWDEMSAGQRAASAIDTGNLVWNGPTVSGAAFDVLCPRTVVEVDAPSPAAGIYEAAVALFGPGCNQSATGEVVLMDDGSGTTSDGCTTTGQDLSGRIALIDRGNCTFVTKVLNAQAAGAVGVIVANNVGGAPFSMGGDGPDVTIPAVMISQADGATLKSALGGGLTATIRPDASRLAGADASGRVQLYNPNPVQPGSSISHWTTAAFPNLLMEPAINSDLPVDVDLTRQLFNDIGWEFFSVGVTRLPALQAERRDGGVRLQWQLHPDLMDHDIYVHRQEAGAARVQVSPGPLAWGATSYLDAGAPDGPVAYWLELVSPQGARTWQGPLDVQGAAVATAFSFAPGFPNPFRTETQLAFTLPAPGEVRITVHDLRGRRVRELAAGAYPAGPHVLQWDGRDGGGAGVAAGVYYARIAYEGQVRSRKLVVMK
jgi:hypothetical protein